MSQITQRGATGPLALVANGSFQTSTDTALATLVGTRWDLSDGREVVLVSTGSTTTTVAGTLYQDAALVAGQQGMTVTAVQAYSANGNIPATVTVTNSTTAVTANQYQGGFLYVQSSTGIGQFLRIAGNSSATTTGALTVTLEDAPNVALRLLRLSPSYLLMARMSLSIRRPRRIRRWVLRCMPLLLRAMDS